MIELPFAAQGDDKLQITLRLITTKRYVLLLVELYVDTQFAVSCLSLYIWYV